MKINFSQIYEGWKNNLFPADEIKEQIRQVSRDRMAICDQCEWCSENKPLISIVLIVDVSYQPRLNVCLVLVL